MGALAKSEAIPPELVVLDSRERAFVEGVLLDGLPWETASLAAGYCAHYSTRLRRRPKIVAALRALKIPDSDRLIASVAQLRESLSETALRADKAADRNGAAALLLKVEGAMGPETYVDARVQSVTYQVGQGSPVALLDVLDVLQRLAEGEEVTPEEAGRILSSYVLSDDTPWPGSAGRELAPNAAG